VADDRGGRARAFPVALWSAFAENHPASKVIHRVVLMVAVEASRMSKPLHRLQSAAERTTSWGRPMDQYKPGDACGPLGRLIDARGGVADPGGTPGTVSGSAATTHQASSAANSLTGT